MSEFIVIIRPSFKKFCKDACRAATFNHLLFRIAGKAKNQPKEKIQDGDILWYAKTEQISEEMADAWGVCKVRKEVNAIVDMGIIGRRSNPTWGADRTKHFCFGQKECRKFLQLCEEHHICFVHLDLPDEVKHLIYISNANDKSIKCTCAIHQMETTDVSNANDKSIEAITIDLPPIDDNKEENKECVSPSPEMTTQFSTLTPSEINVSSEFASHLPQGNTEKPKPPHPKKNHINYDVPEEILARARTLRSKWIEAYGQYGDADWDNAAFIWFAQNGGKDVWGNIQKVRSCMNGRKRNPDRVKSEWSQLEEQLTPSTPQKMLLPPRPKTREELRREPY